MAVFSGCGQRSLKNVEIQDTAVAVEASQPTETSLTETSSVSVVNEQTEATVIDNQDKWFYAKIDVRAYPALMNVNLVSSCYAALPDLCIFNQEYYGTSATDTSAVIHIAERFADLTENTFDRKYDETSDWCYLSIAECWNVIDEWNKMSQLVTYKVTDLKYISQDACTLNIVEFVNDDYNPIIGAYDGKFNHTGEWLGHLHFERRAGGWFLASEDYEPVDMQTQRVIRDNGTVYIN